MVTKKTDVFLDKWERQREFSFWSPTQTGYAWRVPCFDEDLKKLEHAAAYVKRATDMLS